MLLYSALYLLGYEEATIDQLKNFRQLGSKTAGHPEYGHLSGVETTTGPLGQGLANALGMAIAETKLASEFGSDLVDHFTYALVGDGCLMEGISHEAAALAGHLKLNKLIVLWDNNDITIDGYVSLVDSTDQIARFTAYGWNIISIDGHNAKEIKAAIKGAKKERQTNPDRLQDHRRVRGSDQGRKTQGPRRTLRRRRSGRGAQKPGLDRRSF